MQSVKRFLGGGKGKVAGQNNKKIEKPQTQSPVEDLIDLVVGDDECYDPYDELYDDLSPTAAHYMPRSQGTDATLAYLNSDTSDNLTRLLNERNHAEKLARQGPKTKGTREVQLILREPTFRSVEQLYHVRNQAGAVARYGLPGEVAYNVGRSIGWNRIDAPRIPSLHLTNFGEIMEEHSELISNSPYSPYTTSFDPVGEMDLSTRRFSISDDRPLPSDNDAGGWKGAPPSYGDLPPTPHSFPPGTPGPSAEEEWEVREAQFMTIKKVPACRVYETQTPPE